MPQAANKQLEAVVAYHQVTKHDLGRFAPGPGHLDWANQPDPFRRYAGSPLYELPLVAGLTSQSLDLESLGLFFELALGLTAWKAVGDARWSLRANPSSGNLHPTEGYALLPAMAGLGEEVGLYHYAPHEHGLELRCANPTTGAITLPERGEFLIALSSVHWRESWKYGERAFRYCQHDVGHAIGSLAYSAAVLGWRFRIDSRPSDQALSAFLGLGRDDGDHDGEAETPDLLAVVSTGDSFGYPETNGKTEWFGTPNRLSPEHVVWPHIGRVEKACVKPETKSDSTVTTHPELSFPAVEIIRRRRSAVAMDGETSISAARFYAMLRATLSDRHVVPWRSFPYAPRVSLAVFVNRVDGLEPGLYLLSRDPERFTVLKSQLREDFEWAEIGPEDLPLYRLKAADFGQVARRVSCGQDIAADGAFSLGMLSDFTRTLEEEGAWAYRRLFWETGLIGQVLYLEAEAAGIRSTGIGCFLDDQMHRTLGLDDENLEWQILYHFTVGGAVDDDRLMTLSAYHHLPDRSVID